MSPPPPPPTPKHIVRSHGAPVNVVCFSDDNERILSGDAAGVVVVTSTRSLRALAHWKAHTDGLLGLQEFEEQIITSVRVSLTPMPVWMLTMYRLWYNDTQAWT